MSSKTLAVLLDKEFPQNRCEFTIRELTAGAVTMRLSTGDHHRRHSGRYSGRSLAVDDVFIQSNRVDVL
ncbi:hypothetical protein [Pontibaca salina]|uniref:Uncharacterized protein n=1 Tax=Pontibaca salina TaxID=2795731 RepID=A0A934LXT7_9RHOB|nr:hypothetical protein [Pontibaca salina]MBI6629007.1 hypothetical protein [Pontibaca salina]